jgi:hypothetical protein
LQLKLILCALQRSFFFYHVYPAPRYHPDCVLAASPCGAGSKP